MAVWHSGAQMCSHAVIPASLNSNSRQQRNIVNSTDIMVEFGHLPPRYENMQTIHYFLFLLLFLFSAQFLFPHKI